MSIDYVGKKGLSKFLENLYGVFSKKVHTHSKSEITDYTEITVDSALSASSTNPVQNKVIQTEFNNVQDQISQLSSEKANRNSGIFYIVGSGDTAGTWLGSHADITEYFDGLTLAYKTSVAGLSAATTLNINNLGAVTVVRNADTAISTAFPVNSVVLLTYTTDNGTAYWKVADYDSNTKTTTSTTNKSGTKLFLAGATSQGSGKTTYSNSYCYVGTDNCLYSGGEKVATLTEVNTATADMVKYTEQTLTEEQKDQAKANIGVEDVLNDDGIVKQEVLPECYPYFEENGLLFERELTTDTEYFIEDGIWDFTDKISLEVGKTYTVEWDGVQYECVAANGFAYTEMSDTVVLGDAGLEGNVPFAIFVGTITPLYDEDDFVIYTEVCSTEWTNGHSISIYGEKVTKLDNKFLNRTHYEELVTMLPETTVAYNADNQMYTIENAFAFEADVKYKFVIDGVEYECAASYDSEYDRVEIGNGKYDDVSEDNGLPFYFTNDGVNIIGLYDPCTDMTISISKLNVKKLDGKYIDTAAIKLSKCENDLYYNNSVTILTVDGADIALDSTLNKYVVKGSTALTIPEPMSMLGYNLVFKYSNGYVFTFTEKNNVAVEYTISDSGIQTFKGANFTVYNNVDTTNLSAAGTGYVVESSTMYNVVKSGHTATLEFRWVDESIVPKEVLPTLTASDVGALPDTTTALKNPYALTIGETSYDGSKRANYTTIINSMISAKTDAITAESLGILWYVGNTMALFDILRLLSTNHEQCDAITELINSLESATLGSSKNGVYYENDALYYYVNDATQQIVGVVEHTGVSSTGVLYNRDLIYVLSNGQLATGDYWITSTNNLINQGMVNFDENGKTTNAYSVAQNLTSVTSDYEYPYIVTAGGTITLTADTGYTISTVTVTMGGEDITSTVYANGVVTISSATGDIVITATATANAS